MIVTIVDTMIIPHNVDGHNMTGGRHQKRIDECIGTVVGKIIISRYLAAVSLYPINYITHHYARKYTHH
jgi:hypothetical protein